MSLKNQMNKSTGGYLAQMDRLRQAIENAEAIVIGAGAGLSTASGLAYTGGRFRRHFADFIAKYHFTDMYSATFYPYDSPEAYWAYMSRHIALNRYEAPSGQPYQTLLELVRAKDHFVITTNVDHQFQKAGIGKYRLFYTQGDYGLWQCSVPCHSQTYDNEDAVREMLRAQKDLRIPTALVPRCPKCAKPMSMNLRCDGTFVQDGGWDAAFDRYRAFLREHRDQRLLFLELGVGENTPVIIKYPFWQMTLHNSNATYASINLENASCPEEIRAQSICIQADLGQAMEALGGSRL